MFEISRSSGLAEFVDRVPEDRGDTAGVVIRVDECRAFDAIAALPTNGEGGSATALAAAREARANILALRRELTAERSPELPFSLALHIGEVLYGNVGGGRRLD